MTKIKSDELLDSNNDLMKFITAIILHFFIFSLLLGLLENIAVTIFILLNKNLNIAFYSKLLGIFIGFKEGTGVYSFQIFDFAIKCFNLAVFIVALFLIFVFIDRIVKYYIIPYAVKGVFVHAGLLFFTPILFFVNTALHFLQINLIAHYSQMALVSSNILLQVFYFFFITAKFIIFVFFIIVIFLIKYPKHKDCSAVE